MNLLAVLVGVFVFALGWTNYNIRLMEAGAAAAYGGLIA